MEQLLRARVIAFLVEARLLPLDRARMLRGWVHSGFQVPRSRRIAANECQDMERLAQYIVRNPFSVAKMQVNRSGDSILYRSGMNAKIKRNFQVFSACDFIAPIFITVTQRIPDKCFQMVRYYDWYSNKMRGLRRKRAEEAQENAKKNAARKSAATAEQGCGAKVSAAIEIIEHRALKPRRIPSRLRRERINFQRSLTELARANLSAARRRNARRMRPYPSVATTAYVCARRGGMQCATQCQSHSARRCARNSPHYLRRARRILQHGEDSPTHAHYDGRPRV